MGQRIAQASDILHGRYTPEREHSRDRMARGYPDRDEKLQRPVALKPRHAELEASIGRARLPPEIDLTADPHTYTTFSHFPARPSPTVGCLASCPPRAVGRFGGERRLSVWKTVQIVPAAQALVCCNLRRGGAGAGVR